MCVIRRRARAAARTEERPDLVVDDNDDLRQLFRVWFEAFGFTVVTASNGLEALRAVDTCTVRLVLLDLAMPVLDGFGAAEALRARAETSTVPILAVSATITARTRERAREAGIDRCTEKPVDLVHLLDLVRDILRAPSPTDPAAGGSWVAGR